MAARKYMIATRTRDGRTYPIEERQNEKEKKKKKYKAPIVWFL